MIAAYLLTTPRQYVSAGRLHEIDSDGCAYAVESYAGEIWHMNPYCTLCQHSFAEPQIGTICCVCIAKAYKKSSKIKDL